MPAPTVQDAFQLNRWRDAELGNRDVMYTILRACSVTQSKMACMSNQVSAFWRRIAKKHFTGHCVLGLMPYWHWHCPFNWKTYLNELRGFRCTQNHDIALFLFLHIYSIYQEGGGGQDRVRGPSPAPGCLLTTANGTTILYPPSNDGFFNLSCS